MKIEDAINLPDTLNIDLTHYYKNIKVRRGTCVYKIDIDKFLEEFGILVEVIND